MKYLLSALLFLQFLPVLVRGQFNHVPNGSFEYYTNCPSFQGPQIDSCIGWQRYNAGSPDYFNACATYPNRSVPTNNLSYQYADDGNAYAGGIFSINFQNGVAEYITRAISPLSIGSTYEVSISVNLVNNAGYTHNGLGLFLYKNGPVSDAGYGSITQIPQIDYSFYSPITDTQNWTRLTQLYTADSTYDHIVIGAFVNVRNYQGMTLSGNGTTYFFFDSVVIKWVGKSDIYFSDSLLCAGDTIRAPYRVNDITYFSTNNTFTLQLSDSNGSFLNPTIIGTKMSRTSDTLVGVIPKNLKNGAGYRIRMIANNNVDTSEDNGFNIKISNPDSSSINIVTNSPICEGSTLNLSASTNVTPTTYSWTGPSGFSSILQNPVINGALPANSGDYYATLKFYGCEVKDTLSVTVKPLPAKPVANNNSPLCAGDSLHLSSLSSTSGVSYSWAGPGSFASSAQDTSVGNSTTAMSGDYIVTADLNGCNRKDTTTVLVKPLPAAVTLSNNTPICAGDTLQLSSTASTTGSTYSWSGPGSFTATTQNTNRVNITAGMTGWYKMLTGLNGCNYADSTYATIHPIPAVPNISYTNPLCVGETLNLGTATVSGASYSWAGPGNFSSSAQNPARSNMQFGDTGTYKLTTTVNGCTSDTVAATVNINPLPFVVIFANPADSICHGDRVNFTALPNNHGGTPMYQWYVNGQTSGTGSVFSTTTLNDQDIVRCDMTENTKCSVPYTDPSNDITMNVLPWLAPSVSISANPNRPLKENEYVTFTAAASNGGNNPQYQWKRNGQDIVGATGSVWSANALNDNDSISVELVSSYKCPQPAGAQSNGIIVKVLASVGSLGDKSALTLYPNPNNGRFIIETSPGLSEGEVTIYLVNALGQVVYETRITAGNGRLFKEIILPETTPGVYMLRAKYRDRTSLLKVIIY